MTARPALVALVVALVFGLAAPARADSVSSARRRQADARARRARIAARLDAARASDRQLEVAVRALDNNIVTQQAAASAATQAAQAADAAVAVATARLNATRDQRDALRHVVKQRALLAYVSPGRTVLSEVLSSRDITEATRKRALLDEVVGGEHELLDRLRVAEEDLTQQQHELTATQAQAAARRRQATARLVALRAARNDHARLRSALQQRIRDYIAEADAVAKDEASLQAFIRAHDTSASGGDVVGRVSGAGLIWPVRGPVTSPYGMRWGRMHEGIDIGAGSGTAIHAAKAGTVIFSGTKNGYGNVVIIDHGGGFSTLYAHQSRRAAGDGQSVSQGEVIGYVGSTGHSTGPHLHFETRVNGSPQNPRRYLP